MTISAKVIKDSRAHNGSRITTFELVYPRFIHSEFMTHRVFSRNSASSRAIPTWKFNASIIEDMAMPIHMGANQSGMQAEKEISPFKQKIARMLWKGAGYTAISFSYALSKLGVHKQVANRLTEPFQHMRVVVTSTEWSNFFNLRNHSDAQPEIRELAKNMKEELDQSIQHILEDGKWHLPYVEFSNGKYYSFNSMEPITLSEAIAISCASCASTSFKTVDGKPMSLCRAKRILEKLIQSDPRHESPLEHQATPMEKNEKSETSGNFKGFHQLRNHPYVIDLLDKLSKE